MNTTKKLGIIFSFALAQFAHGGTLFIDSTPGLLNSLTPETVAISLHPAWQPNNPDGSDAVWIAPNLSGYGDPVFQSWLAPYTIWKQFEVPVEAWLNLKTWADNTAEVFLDGFSIIPPAWTFGPACTGQPVGCRPQDFGAATRALSAGLHELRFDVYQFPGALDTYNNPSGLLFKGDANWIDPRNVPTPEPATFGLIGVALLGAGVWNRRRHGFSR